MQQQKVNSAFHTGLPFAIREL